MTKNDFIDLYIQLKSEPDKSDPDQLINEYLKPMMEDENVEFTWIDLIISTIVEKSNHYRLYILKEIGATKFPTKQKNKFYISKKFMEFLKDKNLPFKPLIYNQMVNPKFITENIHLFSNKEIQQHIINTPQNIHLFKEQIINFPDNIMAELIEKIKVPQNIIQSWLQHNENNKLTIDTLIEKYTADEILDNFIDILNTKTKNYIIKNFYVSPDIIKKLINQLDHKYILQYAELNDNIINIYKKNTE